MRVLCALLVGVALVAADPWPNPNSIVPAEIQAKLIHTKSSKDPDSFKRVWKNDELNNFGLIKWNAVESLSEKGVPSAFLASAREAVGMLNQTRHSGNDLSFGLHAFRWHEKGLFSKPGLSVEIVIKDKAGKVLFVAYDELEANRRKAESLADTDSEIIGKEIAKRLQTNLVL